MIISTHLHLKPWQVAISRDSSLLIRKWNHIGTHWHVSALSAVYAIGGANIVRMFAKEHKAVYELDNGQFIAIS